MRERHDPALTVVSQSVQLGGDPVTKLLLQQHTKGKQSTVFVCVPTENGLSEHSTKSQKELLGPRVT